MFGKRGKKDYESSSATHPRRQCFRVPPFIEANRLREIKNAKRRKKAEEEKAAEKLGGYFTINENNESVLDVTEFRKHWDAFLSSSTFTWSLDIAHTWAKMSDEEKSLTYAYSSRHHTMIVYNKDLKCYNCATRLEMLFIGADIELCTLDLFLQYTKACSWCKKANISKVFDITSKMHIPLNE